ncbi:MAG: cytochrome c3 family protein [Deltaproteobacteria bacterium]|nr:cytochrome c3 family protein [Deltaproteobacteria bacterium]
MKKTILILTVMLVISLILWGGEASYAMVTGPCGGCHTMHNSQNGADLSPNPYEILLKKNCVGCHSDTNEALYYYMTDGDSSSLKVPVVYTTGSIPTDTLAGGNFYWVSQSDSDAKGHNVFGISGEDGVLDASLGGPGAPGNQYGGDCSTAGCHGTLAIENTGCQGCHLNVRHHANDGTGTKYVGDADKGWYRFLSGHQAATGCGVKGIEDEVWQATTDSHNEYLGVPVDKTGATSLTNYSMTAFCCGCHGDFHTQNDSDAAWIRHPSDSVIPNSGEYAGITANGYSVLSPVARPEGFVWTTGPSDLVAAGTEMVMCLSCHRPHGSPNNDLLRWPYADMIAGGGGAHPNEGCFYCHVTKDD